MFSIKKKVNAIALLSMSVLLVACFDGGSGGSGGVGSITSTFIDAPVDGLLVRIGGSVDETKDGGKFTCKVGDTVEFYIGTLKLGQKSCGSTIYVKDIAADGQWQKSALEPPPRD